MKVCLGCCERFLLLWFGLQVFHEVIQQFILLYCRSLRPAIIVLERYCFMYLTKSGDRLCFSSSNRFPFFLLLAFGIGVPCFMYSLSSAEISSLIVLLNGVVRTHCCLLSIPFVSVTFSSASVQKCWLVSLFCFRSSSYCPNSVGGL